MISSAHDSLFQCDHSSLERLQQFMTIEQEAPATDAGQPPAAWPTSGELIVEGLTARYTVEGPAVLRNVNFTVRAGEKVGIGTCFL